MSSESNFHQIVLMSEEDSVAYYENANIELCLSILEYASGVTEQQKQKIYRQMFLALKSLNRNKDIVQCYSKIKSFNFEVLNIYLNSLWILGRIKDFKSNSILAMEKVLAQKYYNQFERLRETLESKNISHANFYALKVIYHCEVEDYASLSLELSEMKNNYLTKIQKEKILLSTLNHLEKIKEIPEVLENILLNLQLELDIPLHKNDILKFILLNHENKDALVNLSKKNIEDKNALADLRKYIEKKFGFKVGSHTPQTILYNRVEIKSDDALYRAEDFEKSQHNYTQKTNRYLASEEEHKLIDEFEREKNGAKTKKYSYTHYMLQGMYLLSEKISNENEDETSRYLNIAMAQFYQGEYQKALKSLELVSKNVSEISVARIKKMCLIKLTGERT